MDQKQKIRNTSFLPFPTFPYLNFWNALFQLKLIFDQKNEYWPGRPGAVFTITTPSLFWVPKENLDADTEKLDKTFCEYSMNKLKYQEDWRRKKNHFKPAFRREKTEEKKTISRRCALSSAKIAQTAQAFKSYPQEKITFQNVILPTWNLSLYGAVKLLGDGMLTF